MTGIAIAVAVLVAYSTRQHLVPAFAENEALAWIWTMSVVIGIVALIHWLAQERRLSGEWRALNALGGGELGSSIDQLLRSTASARDLVVVSHARQVRDQHEAGVSLAADFKSDWRRIDAERTAHYGAVQRFVASALLLLAVMGTFAGLKDALPRLRDAIRNEARQGSARPSAVGRLTQSSVPTPASDDAISSALDVVANAFGANFMALLMSLVLGAAGFGLARERRALLIEIDGVATRAWYPLFVSDSGTSALERAVSEMRGTAIEVGRVGDGFATLSGRLATYQDTLVDVLQSLSGELRSTVAANAIAAERRQESQLTELARNLGLVTKVLERTAVGYEGLVKGLEERDLGVGEAAEALKGAAERVATVENVLSQATQVLTNMRKEWETRDRQMQRETAALLKELKTMGEVSAETSRQQAASMVEASQTIRALREEQSASWSASHEASIARAELARLQLLRLDEMVGRLEGTNSATLALRGEVAELHASVRTRADAITITASALGEALKSKLLEIVELERAAADAAQRAGDQSAAERRDVVALLRGDVRELTEAVRSARVYAPVDSTESNGQSVVGLPVVTPAAQE